MQISVVPLGTKSPSVSKYVARCIETLKKENDIKYKLNSMGTTVEANFLRKLLSIAEKMHKKVLSAGAKRVVTEIKTDERLDKKLTIKGKVKSVKSKLSF